MALNVEAQSLLKFLDWVAQQKDGYAAIVGRKAIFKHFERANIFITTDDGLDSVICDLEKSGYVFVEKGYSSTSDRYWLVDIEFAQMIQRIKLLVEIQFRNSSSLEIKISPTGFDSIKIKYTHSLIINDSKVPCSEVTHSLDKYHMSIDSEYYETEYAKCVAEEIKQGEMILLDALHNCLFGKTYTSTYAENLTTSSETNIINFEKEAKKQNKKKSKKQKQTKKPKKEQNHQWFF